MSLNSMCWIGLLKASHLVNHSSLTKKTVPFLVNCGWADIQRCRFDNYLSASDLVNAKVEKDQEEKAGRQSFTDNDRENQ